MHFLRVVGYFKALLDAVEFVLTLGKQLEVGRHRLEVVVGVLQRVERAQGSVELDAYELPHSYLSMHATLDAFYRCPPGVVLSSLKLLQELIPLCNFHCAVVKPNYSNIDRGFAERVVLLLQ